MMQPEEQRSNSENNTLRLPLNNPISPTHSLSSQESLVNLRRTVISIKNKAIVIACMLLLLFIMSSVTAVISGDKSENAYKQLKQALASSYNFKNRTVIASYVNNTTIT